MIGPRALREAVRTASVNYSGVLWVIGLLLAFAYGCLRLLISAGSWAATLMVLCVAVPTASAVAAAIYCVFARPDLLRSERHAMQSRLIGLIENSDVNPTAATYARDLLDRDGPKRPDDGFGRLLRTHRGTSPDDPEETG